MVASNMTSLFLAAFVSSSTFRTQNNRASDASPLRGSPRKLQAAVELGKMICGAYEPGCTKGIEEGTVWWNNGAVELRGGPLQDIYFYDERVPKDFHRKKIGTEKLEVFTRKAADVDAEKHGKLNIKSTSTDGSKWTLAAEQFGFLQRTDKLFIISWCRFAAVEFGYAEIDVGTLYDKINPATTNAGATTSAEPCIDPRQGWSVWNKCGCQNGTANPCTESAATPATTAPPATTNAGATTSTDCNSVCTSAGTKKPVNKMCTKYCECTGAGSGMMKETDWHSTISKMICPVQCGSTRFKQRATSCNECKNKSRPNKDDRCNGGRMSSCKWQSGACIAK